jgi:hypothetical protein
VEDVVAEALIPEVVIQAAAAVERNLSPLEIDRMLEGKPPEACRETFEHLRSTAVSVFIDMTICVGRALEVAGYGDKAAEGLAKLFGISRSYVFLHGKVYSEIIRPRLEEHGANAAFHLDEKLFYRLAVEAAPKIVGSSPLELLAHAETEREAKGGYSVGEFRDWLKGRGGEASDDEGSTTSEIKALDRALKKLADFADQTAREWAQHTELNAAGARVRDALFVVQTALAEVELREGGNG